MKRLLFLLFLTPFLLLVGCDQNPNPGDTTKPTVQITLEGTTNTSGAYTDSAKVTITAADAGGSGLSKTEYSLNGSSFQAYSQPFTLTTPGEYVVRARATDGANNVGESEKTFTVVKGDAPADAVDPTVTLTLSGATNASGAYQGKATVTIAATDTGGSGLAAIQYSLDDAPFVPYTAPFEVGTSGSHTVTARASDNAANTTTETKTFTVVGGSADGDTTNPTVEATPTGTQRSPGVYENSATVTITAADEGGSGLAKTEYSLDGGPLQSYSAPFSVSTVGNHTVVARATDGANNIAEDTLTFQVVGSGAPTAPPPNAAEVTLENLDGAPYNDRLVFSRIQNPEDGTNCDPPGSDNCKPVNVVHDTVTLKITNTGGDPLEITALPIQGPWQLVSPPALPTTVAVNASLNLTLKFVATGGDLNTGTMTIVSSASNNQYKIVELAGFWQSVSEGNQEPTLQELVKLFGYTTIITKSGQGVNNGGEVKTVGDEILSPYWQRADTTKPVTVRQLAAYHQQGPVARLYWYQKGGFTKSLSTNTLLTHDDEAGQTVLPPKINTQNAPTVNTFTPDGVFGFKSDAEWSDWSINTINADPAVDANCVNKAKSNPSVVCGHHIRFWPVKDRTGTVVPNTYLLVMDYSGINYDFNDNVYLISNIKPSEAEVPYLIDVAGNGSYTNAEGTWYTDTGSGLFRPSTAKAENPGNTEIFGTDDDQLYWTYRGNVGSAPQDQRQLIYNLPVNAGTYTVTLYFAERFWEAPSKRVFDVSIEGQLRLDDFDIFSASGGKNTAITRTFSNIQVTDGNLTIVFDPSMDYASIAAIKVTK